MSNLVLKTGNVRKESEIRSAVIEAAKPYISKFLSWSKPKTSFPLPEEAVLVLTKNSLTLLRQGWSDYEIDQTIDGWAFLIDQKVVAKVTDAPWRLIPLFVNTVKYNLSPEGISYSVDHLVITGMIKQSVPYDREYFKELWFEKAGYSQSRYGKTSPRLRKKILKRLGYV